VKVISFVVQRGDGRQSSTFMFDCESLYFRLWTKACVSAQQLDQVVFVRRHPVRVFTIDFFREIDEPLEVFRVAEFLHMHAKFQS
jgi:hypothetical protein